VYPKSLHPKKQEGAENCEDNSSPHRNFEQYVECKSGTQHCIKKQYVTQMQNPERKEKIIN
jgi:hypothetical protein